MKEKIILFVIGVLVGAVISTGAFFIYTKMTTPCNHNCKNQIGMPGGNPPSMQDGQNGQPPAKPGENNTQNNDSESSSQTNNDSESNSQTNNN